MKIVLLFPGQGAQKPGMMLDVISAFPEAKDLFDLASQLTGRDYLALIERSSQEELNQTVNTQPTLLLCELAALRILKRHSVPYSAVVGFSLGEWAAAVAAGAVKEADVLPFIEKRADAMQRAVPVGEGAMAYILGQEDAEVEKLCAEIGGVSPANYNCAGNVSVAGTEEAIRRILSAAKEQGIMAERIPVSVPSHSPLMRPAEEELRPLVQAMEINPPVADFYMNATGKAARTEAEIKTNLIDQLVRPVLFRQITEALLDEGYDTFIETGAGSTLSKIVKRIAKSRKRKVKTYYCGTLEKLEATLEALKKREIEI